jgi:protein phosphatase
MSDQHHTRLFIDYGKQTHIGGKTENQDHFSEFLDPQNKGHCFVIADGVGGYRGAGNAAQLAVESILSSFISRDNRPPGNWLHDALQEAHCLLKGRSKPDPSTGKLKTTCVVTVILDGTAYWASVGDSRIYVIRNGAILHRSRDHSVVQVLLDMGEIRPEDVRHHPDRNRILRVLGMDEDMKPTVSSEGLPLLRGDKILLCTDGLWGCIEDKAMVEFITTHSNLRAQELIDALFSKVINDIGENMSRESHDNLSAQLIIVR